MKKVLCATILGPALFALIFPRPGDLLAFNRELVLAGGVWRLWGGNFVHFGWNHFLVNAAVILCITQVFRKVKAADVIHFALISPTIIGIVLLVTRPELEVYGGLSGIASAMFVAGCWELRRVGKNWLAPGMLLVLFVSKLVFEMATGDSLFVGYGDLAVRTEAMAHLAGAASGLVWIWVTIGPRKSQIKGYGKRQNRLGESLCDCSCKRHFQGTSVGPL